jgi:hypothetical protein
MIDDDECVAVGGMRIGRGNRSTRRKPAPVPISPQIPYDLSCTLRPPAHAGSSLADFSTLKTEAIRFSETSVHTRSTQRHIPEDGILHSNRCKNLKSYNVGNRLLNSNKESYTNSLLLFNILDPASWLAFFTWLDEEYRLQQLRSSLKIYNSCRWLSTLRARERCTELSDCPD